MNSELSAIWSSVIPICSNSSRRPFWVGSLISNGKFPLADGALGVSTGGGPTGIDGAGAGTRAGEGTALGAGLERCNRLPKIDRPIPLPFVTGAGPCPREDAKGVLLVSLLACFSRSMTFLMNVFASFSSANERPAKQSSSSKV